MSTYYKEEFQKLLNKLTPDKFGRDPEILGKEILKIIESENPPEEFISGSDWEKDWVYKKLKLRILLPLAVLIHQKSLNYYKTLNLLL